MSWFLTYVRAISDMMAAYRGSKAHPSLDEQGHEEEDNQHVLPSSGDLFYFYAQTLEQCAKFTTGRPLYDLFVVFKKWLRIYAGMDTPSKTVPSLSFRSEDVLMSALRHNEVPQKDRRSLEARFSIVEQQSICRILNTADYCHRTATQVGICLNSVFVGG